MDFSSYVLMTAYHERQAGQTLRARAEAGWFIPHAFLSLLSNNPQDHLSRDGSIHSELPSLINHESRKCPSDLLPVQSYGDIFSIKTPSSQIDLGL